MPTQLPLMLCILAIVILIALIWAHKSGYDIKVIFDIILDLVTFWK